MYVSLQLSLLQTASHNANVAIYRLQRQLDSFVKWDMNASKSTAVQLSRCSVSIPRIPHRLTWRASSLVHSKANARFGQFCPVLANNPLPILINDLQVKHHDRPCIGTVTMTCATPVWYIWLLCIKLQSLLDRWLKYPANSFLVLRGEIIDSFPLDALHSRFVYDRPRSQTCLSWSTLESIAFVQVTSGNDL